MSASTIRKALTVCASLAMLGGLALGSSAASAMNLTVRINPSIGHPAWVNNLNNHTGDMMSTTTTPKAGGPPHQNGGVANDWNLTHHPKP
jgi:hypothetical protein